MANKQKIIIRCLIGCAGVVFLGFCVLFAFAYYCVSKVHRDTVTENNMHDPEFRQEIEEWLDLKFPESVQWEKSELRIWQDRIFNCVFTLPKKDLDLLVPPEKGEWRENDHDMLTQWADDWLKKKKLDHFKIIEYEPKDETKCYVTIVADNPPEADENQRVWVYITCLDM